VAVSLIHLVGFHFGSRLPLLFLNTEVWSFVIVSWWLKGDEQGFVSNTFAFAKPRGALLAVCKVTKLCN
jgi:hypothetical protein